MTKEKYDELINDYFQYDEQDNIEKAQEYVRGLEDKINDDHRKELKKAYLAGRNESAEGWNAEWGVSVGTIEKMADDYCEEEE